MYIHNLSKLFNKLRAIRIHKFGTNIKIELSGKKHGLVWSSVYYHKLSYLDLTCLDLKYYQLIFDTPITNSS